MPKKAAAVASNGPSMEPFWYFSEILIFCFLFGCEDSEKSSLAIRVVRCLFLTGSRGCNLMLKLENLFDDLCPSRFGVFEGISTSRNRSSIQPIILVCVEHDDVVSPPFGLLDVRQLRPKLKAVVDDQFSGNIKFPKIHLCTCSSVFGGNMVILFYNSYSTCTTKTSSLSDPWVVFQSNRYSKKGTECCQM